MHRRLSSMMSGSPWWTLAALLGPGLCACDLGDPQDAANACSEVCPVGTSPDLSAKAVAECGGSASVSVATESGSVEGRCYGQGECSVLCLPPAPCCGEVVWSLTEYRCSAACCPDGSSPPCGNGCSCEGRCGALSCGVVCPPCGGDLVCSAEGVCIDDCPAGRTCGQYCCNGKQTCHQLLCCDAIANCEGRSCGSDGCGGTCGACGAKETCAGGACVPAGGTCIPACGGKECGDDGCGGTCGSCGPGESCKGSACVSGCQPSCAGMECGDDGCGATCGTCAQDEECADGVCECLPACGGKECGDDGCGATCGTCATGASCQGGTCKAGPCTASCAGKECGDDGCGGSCGTCGAGQMCASGACVCKPSCVGKQCGSDGCGGSCGACPANASCVGASCVCQPACAGKACGPDGCGGSCGSCDDLVPCTTDTCSAAGACSHKPSHGLCDDGEECTEDWCDATSGCTNEPSGAACDDGNACTPDDVCVGVVCKGSGKLDCDDGNASTLDACQPAVGCVHEPLPYWVDGATGLTWQSAAPSGKKSWSAAESTCGSLSLGGLGGWRLPTISELRSLVDGCSSVGTGGSCGVTDGCLKPSCANAPAGCNGCTVGQGPDGGCYWPKALSGPCDGATWSASLLDEAGSDSYWTVHFGSAAVKFWDSSSTTAYVRCVR